MEESLKGPTILLAGINIGFYVITSILGLNFLTTNIIVVRYVAFSIIPFLQDFAIWTIFTSIIAHGSLGHIGSNMLFLLIYGFKMEEMGYMYKPVIAVYLITGISSTILSSILFLFFNQIVFTLGASGSVFGILGAVYGIQNKKGDRDARKVLYVSIIFLVLANAPNTNVFAHILGLVAGIIVGKSEFIERLNENQSSLKEFI